MGAPKPTATGTFQQTPLPELIAYGLHKRLNGSFVMECDGHPRTVLFVVEGEAVKVRVAAPDLRLGEILCETAGVPRDELDELAAVARQKGRLLGRHLLSERRITDEQLSAGLRRQLNLSMKWLATLDAEVRYGFFADMDLLDGWGADLANGDPLEHLWHAVQGMADLKRMRAVVRRSLPDVVRLHPDSRILRFGFSANDRAVLDVLRVKPKTLDELVDTGLLQEERLFRVLYTLVVSRHAKLETEHAPLGVNSADSKIPLVHRTASHFRGRRQPEKTSKSNSSLRAEPAKGALGTLRGEIEALGERLDTMTYYEILDVPSGTDSASVRRAFFTLARKWHPDKLHASLSDLVPTVTRIFAKMTEAHQVLSSEKQRQQYDKLQHAQGEQETVQRVLRAATNFKKAEVLVKKRDLAGAEKLAEKATEDDPEQAEYLALYAWIAAKNRFAEGVKQFEDLVGLAEKAMQMQQENMRVHYYRAVVFKLAGRKKEAQKAFRYVVENDPSNVDAARELRLFKMRNEGAEDASSSGFFSRFFKKD